MSFNRYFVTSSYALLAVSFVMLVTTGQLGLLMIIPFIGVMVTGWLIDTGRLAWTVAPATSKWVVIGYSLVAFILLQIWGWRALVSVVLYFIVLSASVRLLRIKTNRDWLWLYVVSFCQVLMTAA